MLLIHTYEASMNAPNMRALLANFQDASRSFYGIMAPDECHNAQWACSLHRAYISWVGHFSNSPSRLDHQALTVCGMCATFSSSSSPVCMCHMVLFDGCGM